MLSSVTLNNANHGKITKIVIKFNLFLGHLKIPLSVHKKPCITYVISAPTKPI